MAASLVWCLWLPYLLARPLGIVAANWITLAQTIAFTIVSVVTSPQLSVGSISTPFRLFSISRSVRFFPAVILVALLTLLLFNSNLRERDGGLSSTGVACEDMGIHSTLAFSFLRAPIQTVHPEYPIFPGWPLGYPFLADFAAAGAMSTGSAVGTGFFVTALFAAIALLVNLYAFARRWLSPAYSTLTLFLFLLGGNLGIVLFLEDGLRDGFGGLLLEDYANNANFGLHLGNIVTAILLPMRTSLFGAPIALAAINLLSSRRELSGAEIVFGGLLIGSLPLINAHACVAAVFCAGMYFILGSTTERLALLKALAWSGVVAFPQLRWIFQQISGSTTSFIRLSNGFLAGTELDWSRYWLLNGGLLVPFSCCAWWFSPRELRRTALPLLLLLPLAMFVAFQPYSFDNIKLLVFFQIGAAVLIAESIYRLMQSGAWARSTAFAGILLCCASGVLSWYREANIPCQMASVEDRKFAESFVRLSGEHSLVLTGQKFNHPVPFLTGRTVFLGFHNWLDQHGIPFRDRAEQVKEIYRGGALATELLARYRITEIVVGPYERAEFSDLNEDFLRHAARSTESIGAYTVYRMQ